MRTLLLDVSAWDLVLDINGNIAVASNPYALGQDAASAIKLFRSELYYDTTKGVVYFGTILGATPPLALLKSRFNDAALTVPEVVSAKCFISAISERKVAGQVQVTDKSGRTAAAAF
jgi:hypothetical protein